MRMDGIGWRVGPLIYHGAAPGYNVRGAWAGGAATIAALSAEERA